MMTLEQNKQKMFYSLYLGQQPEYELDDKGNKILLFVDSEGKEYYKETGEIIEVYSTPVEFKGNISFGGGESRDAEYGFDISSYSAVLVVGKGMLPLTETSVIWYENEPTITEGGADGKLADYKIVKVSPSLNVDKYILQKVVK